MPLGVIGQTVGTRARRISGLALYLCGTLLPISAARGTTFTVNTVSDVDDATIDGVCETATGNGTCTLRAAVAEADADPGQPDVFVVPPGIYPIWLGRIQVDSTMTIAGAGAGLAIFEPAVGGLARELFRFDGPGHLLALENFTVRNFSAPGSTATVTSFAGSLQVRRCSLESNAGIGNGGAIALLSFDGFTPLLVEDTTFYNNSADWGGSIFLVNCGEGVTIRGSIFEGNGAITAGGALYVQTCGPNQGLVRVEASLFADNDADTGGAIEVFADARLHLVESTVH